MIIETGRVVAVEDGALWVETIRRSTCESCSARNACGHGLMNRVGAGRRNHVRALFDSPDNVEYQVDDLVRISIPDHLLVQASAIVYLLPLLTMVAGLLLAPQGSDAGAALGAVLGLGLGFLAVWLHGRWSRDHQALQPRVVERVGRAEAGIARCA
ncbi:MAG TPA: SoxR reducing system RseC family protein [Spongiibacteraceae bacterium]|nr:SoxR reducing system RseC family protein [Spongiibacteraceae bacterium]HUH38721.1 SoxR reducing system RseC family protein [Spongiibacteraceae bacterium]